MHPTAPRTSSLRRWFAVLALCGLVLTACGNSDDDDGASPTTTEAEGASTDDTAADEGDEPAEGGDTGEFQPIEGVNGVTDDEIQFAVLGTGPSNPLGYCLLECYEAGVQARFEYQNSIGGVHGRDVVVSRVEDDEMGNTQVKLLELVEAADVFGILGAPLLYSGYADVGATDVPLYTTFPASPESDGFDNIYVAGGTICIDCPSPATVQGAVLAGATKVASLGFGVSQASKECVTSTKETFEIYGEGAGIEFVYENSELAFGFPNGVGPEVTAMKDAGVDYISTCIDQTSVLTLKQELERQGMTDVVVVLPQGYGDDEYLSTNADLLEGDILSVRYRPVEADAGDSMLPTMVEQLEGAGMELNDYAIQGWIGADMAITALLEAGPQFDQAGVVEAMNQVSDYTAGGLTQPIDWTRAHDAPGEDTEFRQCAAYLRVRDGGLELEGDAAEPFFCWDMPLDGWVEPETAG